MTEFRKPRLTERINLPGGQARLREMILYVSQRCAKAERFGAIKLNKILWKADFDAFAARGVPVTGRAYQRLPLGPAPREMLRVSNDMLRDNLIRIERIEFGQNEDGEDVVELRTIALADPNLEKFSTEDLNFVHRAIEYYWDMTGTETSDDSHGAAWRTHNNGDPLPYELARLSDRPLSRAMRQRITDHAKERGWATR
jgi:antitoxin SocA-like protein